MVNTIYSLLVLLVAFPAIIGGFKRGITRQVASLLGFAFGAVAARVFTPEFSGSFQWAAHLSQAPEFAGLTVNLVCGVVIYSIVFLLFSFLSPILRLALSVFEIGMFNRLLGAFFSLLKNLLWLSIFLNLLVCLFPGSGLLRYEKANDGNAVSGVMALTPAFLGCPGAADFAHFNQLKEAKSISCNFLDVPNFQEFRNFNQPINVILT